MLLGSSDPAPSEILSLVSEGGVPSVSAPSTSSVPGTAFLPPLQDKGLKNLILPPEQRVLAPASSAAVLGPGSTLFERLC